MSEPTDFLQSVRASSAELVQDVEAQRWSDTDAATPSLCPGWTRGHVLTHLARNADGIAATLAAAMRDEIVARYPDGWDARNADIDAGADRPLATLLADVRESAQRLDRVLGALTDAEAWQRPTENGHPAQYWLAQRWREVEIHRVDLAGSYTPDRWPPLFVATLLPEVARTLAERTSGAVQVSVVADGSLSPDTAGASWSAGEGDDPVEVRGPDWAVLAWLVGRASVAEAALSATPALADWR